MKVTACPSCGHENLYHARSGANGGYGPALLPGLGTFLEPAQFDIVVCADCGLTRFFAAESERAEVQASEHWSRVSPAKS
jgi:predicted nucleic-acid-binding Zn-ribbon protein